MYIYGAKRMQTLLFFFETKKQNKTSLYLLGNCQKTGIENIGNKK